MSELKRTQLYDVHVATGQRVMFSPAPREPSETFSQGQSRSSDL